jgi:hypothetical protein
MRSKFFFVLLAVMLSAFAGQGSPAVKSLVAKVGVIKVPSQIIKDTSSIQAKHFDQHVLTQFRKSSDFNYKDRAGAGEPSFLERCWIWLKHVLFGWLENARIDGTWTGFFLTALKYLIYAAVLALLVFVIIKAIGIDTTKLFRGKSKRLDLPYTESLEDINVIDFDGELEKALAKNNYRLAVRLLYLNSLKQLSDMQLIHWQIDKTNSAYVNELSDPSRKQAFGLITRQFEYVWYGNFNIDKTTFVSVSNLFQDFKKQLS